MKIDFLKLINFRNYDNLKVEFFPKLNIIYGLNGSGKTNLVEAIYMLSLTKSFRINNDKILIQKGFDKTIIEGEIEKRNNKENYKVILNKDGKKVEINNNKVDKISNYVSKINVVLFNPEDTGLVSSSPSERRSLLNIEISQLYKEYLIVLASYNRILKQRNSYLKQLYINGNASKDYLDILTNKLIENGLIIYEYRKKFVESLNKYITDIYFNIFGQGQLKLKYVSSYSNKDQNDLMKMYDKYYSKELSLGKTMIGIHHDDLIFSLDGNNLKEWGSEGQRKNSIISFKLAELNVIYEIKKYYPILILDDLFSELDKEKIENILKLLNNEVQTFITTTDIKSVNKKLLTEAKKFKVCDGKIEEEL